MLAVTWLYLICFSASNNSLFKFTCQKWMHGSMWESIDSISIWCGSKLLLGAIFWSCLQQGHPPRHTLPPSFQGWNPWAELIENYCQLHEPIFKLLQFVRVRLSSWAELENLFVENAVSIIRWQLDHRSPPLAAMLCLTGLLDKTGELLYAAAAQPFALTIRSMQVVIVCMDCAGMDQHFMQVMVAAEYQFQEVIINWCFVSIHSLLLH